MYKWTKCHKGPHVHIQTYVDRVKMTFCLHVLKSHCRTLKHYCHTQVITHHQAITAWIYMSLSMLATECKWSDRSTCLHTIVGCENCNDVGRDLWPHINITLEHYDKRTFGIVISWDKPGSFVYCWEVCCSMTTMVLLCCTPRSCDRVCTDGETEWDKEWELWRRRLG